MFNGYVASKIKPKIVSLREDTRSHSTTLFIFLTSLQKKNKASIIFKGQGLLRFLRMYMQVSLCAPEKNYRDGPTQKNDINWVEFTREQTEVKR